MDDFDFDAYDDLLDPPVKRAAYADRTAWLMAVMSQLAYLPFEGPPDPKGLRSIAESIAEKPDVASVVAALETLVRQSSQGGGGETQLKTALGKLRFELVDSFSVVVPLCTDSQAFIARVSKDWRDGGKNDYLVVAFRGTEPRKIADIKTDLQARLIEAPGPSHTQAKVHEGFYRALVNAPPGGRSIRARINDAIKKHEDLPVFVTGHSLGGALAVVATRYIANGSRGACYTFGQPRVGNQHFIEQIFTPVYRVVNAADIVPAVPLKESAINALISLIALLRFLPGPARKWFEHNLKKIKGYRHGGAIHYLTRAKRVQTPNQPARYPDLEILTAPSAWDRWGPSLPTFASFQFDALIKDHSVSLYVEKLAAYAQMRQDLRRELNPPSDDPTGGAPDPPAAAPARKAAASTTRSTTVKATARTSKTAAAKSSAKAKAPAKSGAKSQAKTATNPKSAASKTPAASKSSAPARKTTTRRASSSSRKGSSGSSRST